MIDGHHLLRPLKERIAAQEADLAKGGAADWAAYRHAVGFLAGLSAAHEAVRAALEKQEIDVDDG